MVFSVLRTPIGLSVVSYLPIVCFLTIRSFDHPVVQCLSLQQGATPEHLQSMHGAVLIFLLPLTTTDLVVPTWYEHGASYYAHHLNTRHIHPVVHVVVETDRLRFCHLRYHRIGETTFVLVVEMFGLISLVARFDQTSN